MQHKIILTLLALSAMLCFSTIVNADDFTVSEEFKNIQNIWIEEYGAEFPVDEVTVAQPPGSSLADLRYKFSSSDQQMIFSAILAINSQNGNEQTKKLLANYGFKSESSGEQFVNIYSKLTGKQLQVLVVFKNLLPENITRFAADCGSPIRYMDFDDAVHSYFSTIAEPPMRKGRLYELCQTAKSNNNVQLVFCGAQFGGGFALVAGAIASQSFSIPLQQIKVIQFAAPSVAGKGFIDAFKGKLNVTNFIRPNDPLALTLNSLHFYPFGNVVNVHCEYADVLDNSGLYRAVADSACANFITDIWNAGQPQAVFDSSIIPLQTRHIHPSIDLKNVNTQQYLFLGGLTAGAAMAIYNDNFLPFSNHLSKHDFNLTRFTGKDIYQTPTSTKPISTFSAVYSKRLDTDGKNYYIVGFGVNSLDFLKRLDKDFVVESPIFGNMIRPVADDLNQLLKDQSFGSFLNQLKSDKSSRVLISGYGAGGSYAAYLAALIASDESVDPGHIRLLTAGDWAAVSPKMQALLTEKVKAFRISNYRDVIPCLGEYATNSPVLSAPLFMEQNGELVALTPGYIANYTLAEHNYAKYFGIILKNSKDYITRWNEEIWQRQQAKLNAEAKQKEAISSNRMICVTSPCEPW